MQQALIFLAISLWNPHEVPIADPYREAQAECTASLLRDIPRAKWEVSANALVRDPNTCPRANAGGYSANANIHSHNYKARLDFARRAERTNP